MESFIFVFSSPLVNSSTNPRCRRRKNSTIQIYYKIFLESIGMWINPQNIPTLLSFHFWNFRMSITENKNDGKKIMLATISPLPLFSFIFFAFKYFSNDLPIKQGSFTTPQKRVYLFYLLVFFIVFKLSSEF